MTTRIQLRRDTASNWTLNNPMLLTGEIGIESDTNKFKIGNGSRWNSINNYAFNPGSPNGIATLGSTGKLISSQLPDQYSLDAEISSALANLSTSGVPEGTNKYFTNARALAANASAISDAASSAAIDATSKANSAQANAISIAAADATSKANSAQANAIATASNDASTKDAALATTITSSTNTSINSAISTEVTARNTAINNAISAEIINRNTAIHSEINALTTSNILEGTNKYFTDARAKAAVASDITAAISQSGSNLSTKTTNDLAEGSTNLYFTTQRARQAAAYPIGQLADSIGGAIDDISSQLSDLSNNLNSLNNTVVSGGYLTAADIYMPDGVAGLDNTGHIPAQYIPSTIARNSDVDSRINAIINSAPSALDTLGELASALSADESAAATLSTLVGTKLSSSLAATTYETISNVALKAPLNNPTFTGTVNGITKSMVGLSNVNNTSDSDKPVSSATASALALKAPINSPTFTGTVDLSGATVVGLSTLPSQINNSGKFLTTNGTSASWSSIDLSSYLTQTYADSTYSTKTYADSTYATTSSLNSVSTTASTALTNANNALVYGYHNSKNGITTQNKISYGTNSTPDIMSPSAGDIYIQY